MGDPYRDKPRSMRGRGDYFCPGCGLAVARSARHCPECNAAVASVRCAGCYHMNVPDDALCAACGEPLGLEPAGEPTYLACTRCVRPFEAFRGGPGALYDCGRCGGQFVEHALLRDLLERRELYGGAVPRRPKRFTPDLGPVVYVKCPTCQVPMNRKNFGRSSGVIVDVCALHGTWFDAGELPSVLKFVETGGLAEARRLADEERHLEAARDKARHVEETLGRLSQPVDRGLYMDSHGAVVEAALGLLSLLEDVLK